MSFYVTRKGDQLITRFGEAIMTLHGRVRENSTETRNGKIIHVTAFDYFSHLQEGVEVEIKFRPTDSPEKLTEEIKEIDESLASLTAKRRQLESRLLKATS
jgi:predicted DNA-binding antitoxin AbrB/MazE fold protein